MKKLIITLMSAALVAGYTVPSANAADDDKKPAKKESAKKKSAKKKRSTFPFRGVVGEVDGDTLVLKYKTRDRKIKVSKDAKVTKMGKKAKLSDIKAGAYVTGQIKRSEDGDLAISVYEKEKPQSKSKGSKSGKKKPAKKKKSDDDK